MTSHRRPVMPSPVDAAEIRAAIRSAALGGGASRERAEDLALATWELVLNAIEHGAGPPVITIGLAGDRITVLVTEPGRSSADPTATAGTATVMDPWACRGRGQSIVQALADEVHRFERPEAFYVEVSIRLPG